MARRQPGMHSWKMKVVTFWLQNVIQEDGCCNHRFLKQNCFALI